MATYSKINCTMPLPTRSRCLVRAAAAAVVLLTFLSTPRLAAQTPSGGFSGTNLPSPEVAKELLRTRPDLAQQLRQRIGASGLSPTQVRARLRAAGYPENLLDDYLAGGDTTGVNGQLAPRTLDAVRALGIVDAQEVDSRREADSLRLFGDSTTVAADSARADSLRADSLRAGNAQQARQPLRIFGADVFRRASNRFEPAQAGPVDASYRLGPGDELVLILTGDVEQSYELPVTREGFIVIPQAGQLYAANLTLAQLEELLYSRLGRVYSGIRRGANARTRFQLSLSKIKKVQVFVLGEVSRPGAYQISGVGSGLTALYAAGGPTDNGSFRRVDVRRGSKLVDSLDLYDYLLAGTSAADAQLQSGDVLFVPVHGAQVKITGSVVRPAIYEMRPTETLRDLLRDAGGFEAGAVRQRVQIHRIAAANPSGDLSHSRVVLEIGADQFADGIVPAVALSGGDSVVVFKLPARSRGFVTVRGDVWAEGVVGLEPGMKLSEAVRRAGGVKPDVYLDQILISRLRPDSTRIQLRSAFADSTGRVVNDLVLQEDDDVRIFSISGFRNTPFVVVTGAVRRPGRLPYRQGMTARDAILLASGLSDDASLIDAEVARLPAERALGVIAQTVPLPLDSTYLFDRGRYGGYAGAPGLSAQASGAPDVVLRPYDNVLIRRAVAFELPRTVRLTGEVQRPGPYPLTSKTERLADVIARAGGLRPTAYPGGIEFFRGQGPARRIGIDLPALLKEPHHRDNIILAAGDSIHIPEFNPIVEVVGAVNAPGGVSYIPNGDIDDYVNAAGGYSRKGDRSRAYVTQPDGKTSSVERRFLLADSKPNPRPGALVFVPEKDAVQASNLPAILGVAAQLLAALVTIIVVARK